jgi:hypothetical protein
MDWLNMPTNEDDLISHKFLFSLFLIVLFLTFFYLSFLNYNYSLYVKNLFNITDSYNISLVGIGKGV